MTQEVVVAFIGLGGSAIGSVIGILTSTKLNNYRIAQLEKKVDKHNNLIERMFKCEDKINVLNERQKVANNRIKDLEDKEK